MPTDIDLAERYAIAQALNSPIRSGHTGTVIPAVLVQLSIRPRLIGVRPVPDAMDMRIVSATGFVSTVCLRQETGPKFHRNTVCLKSKIII